MNVRLIVAVVILAVAGTGCFKLGEGAGPRPAVPGAVVGGTVTVGIERPLSIDPADADVNDRSGHLLLSTLCDPLLGLDPVTGEVVPSLVESWTVDDAAKSYNLTLEKDLRFSDGTKVTAIDVAFSLTRVASQEQGSPVAELLAPVVGFATVHGDVPSSSREDREQLRGVRVVSDRSLEIRLTEPRADFLMTLTHPALTPLPKQRVERRPDGVRRQPVCVGPYALDAPYSVTAPRVKLRRSAAYFAGSVVNTRGGRGYVDAIDFVIGRDRAALAASYAGGEVDAALVDVGGSSGGDGVVQAPTGVLEYIGLPTRTPPFDRREVRQAMSLALDRSALAAGAFAGTAVPATSFLPPTVMADLATAAECDGAPRRGADVEKARQLLEAAGVSLDGKALELTFNDEHDNRAVVAAVAEQWRAAFGVVPTLTGVPWQQYRAAGVQPGFTTPFRYGWGAQTPDPDAYLNPLFGSFGIGADNVSQFISASFDRTLTRIVRRATAEEGRISGYARLARSLCTHLPMIPVAARVAGTAVRRNVLASATPTFTDRATGQLLLREIYRTGVREEASS